MKSIYLCYLDNWSLEGCMHLVNQLLVPTTGTIHLAVSLAAYKLSEPIKIMTATENA